MVQLSPNTEAPLGGGYRYSRPMTWGFGMNHLSGTGCALQGDVVSLPRTGPVETVEARHLKVAFSHAGESASPGAYAVTLANGVRAELTATPRTGWTRYAWPATRTADLVVDPAGFRGSRDAAVRIVGDRAIEGWTSSWGLWGTCPTRGENRYRVYFHMTFSRPFRAYGTGNAERLLRHRRSARGFDAGAYVVFDARDGAPVVAKTGISYVSVAGARRNLAAEGGSGFDFDAVRSAAQARWNAELGRVAVGGGPPRAAATFYTALYHSLLAPTLFSDVDGRYVGFDGRVHGVPRGRAHYTSYSLWDTYRSAAQVIDLVTPEVVPDMMRSLLDDRAQGGWLPKWVFGDFETNEMVGDPAANVLVDAYLKGLLRRGDVGRAWSALLHNATSVPDADERFEGRTGLEGFVDDGYVGWRPKGDFNVAASLNLEYAVNDCALALMAARLGNDADRRYLLRRAKRWRYTLDASVGLARPRHPDGAWVAPFAATSRTGFKEGAAGPYTWLVPQDVGGLARALGGRPQTRAKLDAFFASWHGAGFTPQNEHDLQAPYLYDYLGQPWKTAALVRRIEALYTTAPNGLPGSDDLGTMSGWYVLSALGLFPLMGGDDSYALTTPLFDHVALSGFAIDAPGTQTNPYVASATLDGRPLATSALPHAALRAGSRLVYSLQPAPEAAWATGSDTPVSACATNPRTADLRPRFVSSRPGTLRMRIGNPGDAFARHIHVQMRALPGWRVTPALRTVRVLAARSATVVTWRVTAPAGARSGHVAARLAWSGATGAGGALRAFATGVARAAGP
jgi:predicted alpha-1,2-mannosidase